MRLKSGLLLTIWGALMAGTAMAASAQLEGLRTIVDQQATSFVLRLPKPVKYTPSPIGPRLFIIDLAGVSTNRPAESQPVQSPLVSSYRLLNYQGADSQPHLALEITLKEEAEVKPIEVAEGLQIKVQRIEAKAPATPVAVRAAPPAVPRPAAAEPATAPAQSEAFLREVSVVQPDGGSGLEVEIVGNRELTYRTLQLSGPDRLVLDLPNTVNRIRQKQLAINTPPLRSVRIGQFTRRPPVSRIVLDLDSKAPFRIRSQSNTLVVSLGNPGVAETAKKTPEASQREANGSLREPAEPLLVASNQPNMAAAALPDFPPVRVPASLPVASPREAPVSTVPLPAVPELSRDAFLQAPSTADPAPSLVALESAGEATTEVAATPPAASAEPQGSAMPLKPQTPALVAVAQAAPVAPAQTSATQALYTGEPISVDLKDVDLKDFFRLMHEISGLNIVLDPNVSGTLTIVLDEVPWDQAMDIVLRNNQLGKEVMGNVVRIAKLSTLEAEKKQQQALAQANEVAEPRQTVSRALSYAKAADLIATLKRFLSSRGDLVADTRTNTLIITDIPAAIAQLDGLIGTLDRKSLQVEIEARVVAASRSFARDIGIQLAASMKSGNVVLGGTGTVGESPIKRGLVPPLFIGAAPKIDPDALIPKFANVSQPLVANFPAVGATSGVTVLLTAGANFALDSILTAAESKGIGKLLSRPKVVTQNNVQAVVKQGVRIPIQTSVNNTVSVQFVDVVLRLTVTPQITAEGTIFLQTDVENTTIDPGIARINGVPALDTQQATTQVLVNNGGTVFFGGVIQTQNNFTEVQTPLLGSIPLIGNLFKRRGTSTTTNELLFFITPKIIQS